jgi:hypothetical protein
MTNKEVDLDGAHACWDYDTVLTQVKSWYRVAMHEQELNPAIIGAIEKRVGELRDE